MAIPESQLDTWSHQGSITNSANTGNSVKNALDSYTGFPDGVTFDVYFLPGRVSAPSIEAKQDTVG